MELSIPGESIFARTLCGAEIRGDECCKLCYQLHSPDGVYWGDRGLTCFLMFSYHCEKLVTISMKMWKRVERTLSQQDML